MEISDEEFNRLANLSKLLFTEEEKEELKVDLQKMVSYVEKLNEVHTENVPPLLHISNAVNVWREDEVNGFVTREEALLNAPATDQVFIKVPKVIKK